MQSALEGVRTLGGPTHAVVSGNLSTFYQPLVTAQTHSFVSGNLSTLYQPLVGVRPIRTRFIRIGLAALVLAASAYADAIFTRDNSHQPNEENILFHNPTKTGTKPDNNVAKEAVNESDSNFAFVGNVLLGGTGLIYYIHHADGIY